MMSPSVFLMLTLVKVGGGKTSYLMRLSVDLLAASLNSIISNSYYGMLRGQISMYLPPKHPIIAL